MILENRKKIEEFDPVQNGLQEIFHDNALRLFDLT